MNEAIIKELERIGDEIGFLRERISHESEVWQKKVDELVESIKKKKLGEV